MVSPGHELEFQGFGVRASRRTFWATIAATEELLRVKIAAAETLEALVATWVWLMLVMKPALSVWCRVFAFVREDPGQAPQKIPG